MAFGRAMLRQPLESAWHCGHDAAPVVVLVVRPQPAVEAAVPATNNWCSTCGNTGTNSGSLDLMVRMTCGDPGTK